MLCAAGLIADSMLCEVLVASNPVASQNSQVSHHSLDLRYAQRTERGHPSCRDSRPQDVQSFVVGELLNCRARGDVWPAFTASPIQPVAVCANRFKRFPSILSGRMALMTIIGRGFRILQLTVFLAKLGYYGGMNSVFKTYFPNGGPARTTVAVAGSPGESLVEINCLAAVVRRRKEGDVVEGADIAMQSSEIILCRLVTRLKIRVPDTFQLGAILPFSASRRTAFALSR